MRRVLEFAYNPETGNWHLRAGDMSDDYIGDRESVKTFYEYESLCLDTIEKISDKALDIIQTMQIERFQEWRKDYPADLFPNEKFSLFK